MVRAKGESQSQLHKHTHVNINIQTRSGVLPPPTILHLCMKNACILGDKSERILLFTLCRMGRGAAASATQLLICGSESRPQPLILHHLSR